jgi:membrane protease YdiL (CAAX protease family)
VTHLFNLYISPLAMIGLMVAGFLLATASLVTRSLWLPIGLHIGWNLAIVRIRIVVLLIGYQVASRRKNSTPPLHLL